MSDTSAKQGLDRIDRLQASVEALTRDVADTAATVRSLAGTVGAVVRRQDEAERTLRESNRLNWAPVSIMATVVIAVATIAGGLIAYAIASESDGRKIGDRHIESSFASVLQERDATDKAQRDGVMQASDFRHQIAIGQIGEVSRDVIALTERMQRHESTTDERFREMDEILQREMRILDEVLQREMGLHVERLDALIEVINSSLKEVESSRFTDSDGQRIERQVEGLLQKQGVE
jgi:hypothetical protein